MPQCDREEDGMRCRSHQFGRALLLIPLALVLGPPGVRSAQPSTSGFELHALITGLDLGSSVGENGTGLGARIVRDLSSSTGLEIEGAYFPENPQGNYGQVLVLVGGSAVVRVGRWGPAFCSAPGCSTSAAAPSGSITEPR